jgi:hypothetical protein
VQIEWIQFESSFLNTSQTLGGNAVLSSGILYYEGLGKIALFFEIFTSGELGRV